MADAAPPLTDKERRFVDEYLVDLNATQAAIRAGYSEDSAASIGSENLRKPHIAARVEKRMAAREARTEVTQDRIVQELARVAFGDARRVMSWGPDGVTLIDSETLDDDAAALVAEASETTTQHGGSVKLKVNDKVKALELLGRHMGMFNDKLIHGGKVEGGFSLTVVRSEKAAA
jgi:phage terminase small subunit